MGEITPQHRDVFYPNDPHCVRLKLITDCEIPAPGDPKIEKCETLKTRAVLYPKKGGKSKDKPPRGEENANPCC